MNETVESYAESSIGSNGSIDSAEPDKTGCTKQDRSSYDEPDKSSSTEPDKSNFFTEQESHCESLLIKTSKVKEKKIHSGGGDYLSSFNGDSCSGRMPENGAEDECRERTSVVHSLNDCKGSEVHSFDCRLVIDIETADTPTTAAHSVESEAENRSVDYSYTDITKFMSPENPSSQENVIHEDAECERREGVGITAGILSEQQQHGVYDGQVEAKLLHSACCDEIGVDDRVEKIIASGVENNENRSNIVTAVDNECDQVTVDLGVTEGIKSDHCVESTNNNGNQSNSEISNNENKAIDLYTSSVENELIEISVNVSQANEETTIVISEDSVGIEGSAENSCKTNFSSISADVNVSSIEENHGTNEIPCDAVDVSEKDKCAESGLVGGTTELSTESIDKDITSCQSMSISNAISLFQDDIEDGDMISCVSTNSANVSNVNNTVSKEVKSVSSSKDDIRNDSARIDSLSARIDSLTAVTGLDREEYISVDDSDGESEAIDKINKTVVNTDSSTSSNIQKTDKAGAKNAALYSDLKISKGNVSISVTDSQVISVNVSDSIVMDNHDQRLYEKEKELEKLQQEQRFIKSKEQAVHSKRGDFVSAGRDKSDTSVGSSLAKQSLSSSSVDDVRDVSGQLLDRSRVSSKATIASGNCATNYNRTASEFTNHHRNMTVENNVGGVHDGNTRADIGEAISLDAQNNRKEVNSDSVHLDRNLTEKNTRERGNTEPFVREKDSFKSAANAQEQDLSSDILMVRHTQRGKKRKSSIPLPYVVSEVEVKQEKPDEGFSMAESGNVNEFYSNSRNVPLGTVHHMQGQARLQPNIDSMLAQQSLRNLQSLGRNNMNMVAKAGMSKNNATSRVSVINSNQRLPVTPGVNMMPGISCRTVQMSRGSLVVVPTMNNSMNSSGGRMLIEQGKTSSPMIVVAHPYVSSMSQPALHSAPLQPARFTSAALPTLSNGNIPIVTQNISIPPPNRSAAVKVATLKALPIVKRWIQNLAHPLGEPRTAVLPGKDLHLESSVSKMLCTCESCGDEFMTQAGLDDHYARRSIQITFQCRCESRNTPPHVFYNPCAYSKFHRNHVLQLYRLTGRNKSVLHTTVEACIIKPLCEEPLDSGNCVRSKSVPTGENGSNSDKNVSEVTTVQNAPPVTVHTTAEKYQSEQQSSGNNISTEGVIDTLGASVESDTESSVSVLVDKSNMLSAESLSSSLASPGTEAKAASSSPQVTEDVEEGLEEQISELSVALSRKQAQCTECKRAYKIPSLLAMHFSRQNNTSGTTLQQLRLCCPHCSMVLPNSCSYKAHLRLHVGGRNIGDCETVEEVSGKPPFVCPECGVCFDKSGPVFLKHLNQVCRHFSRYTEFQCTICSAHLQPTVDVVSKHIIEKHSTTYSKCSMCPMAFSSSAAYEKHSIERHSASSVCKVIGKCPVCDKVLSSVNDLRVHIVLHVEQFRLQTRILHRFRCAPCKETFSNKKALCDHVRAQHSDDMVRGIMCECCGETFDGGNMRSYHIHLIKSHPEYVQSIIQAKPTIADSPSISLASGLSNQLSDKVQQSAGTIADNSGATKEPVPVDLRCERCQISFASEILYKRHNAKHRYIAGKKRPADSDVNYLQNPLDKKEHSEESSVATKVEDQVGSLSPCSQNALEVQGVVQEHRQERLGVVIKVATGRRREGNRIVGVRSLGEPSKKSRDRSVNHNRASPVTAGPKKILDSPKCLQSQVPTAAPDLRFKCTMCETRFNCNVEVKSHVESAHSMARWYPCQLCEVSYRDELLLAAHVRERHTAGKERNSAYVCWICREQGLVKGYPRRRLLVKHLKSLHKLSRPRVDVSELIDKHCGGAGVVECNQLGEDHEESSATPTQNPEVRRLRLIDDSTASAFTCSQCQFSSSARNQFKEHIISHRHDDMSAQCAECGACFSTIVALRRHLFIVHRVRDFPAYVTESGACLDQETSGSSGEDEPKAAGSTARKRVHSPDQSRRNELEPSAMKRASVELNKIGDKKSVSVRQVESGGESGRDKETKFECTVCYKTFDDVNAHRSHMRVHGMAFIQRTRRSLSHQSDVGQLDSARVMPTVTSNASAPSAISEAGVTLSSSSSSVCSTASTLTADETPIALSIAVNCQSISRTDGIDQQGLSGALTVQTETTGTIATQKQSTQAESHSIVDRNLADNTSAMLSNLSPVSTESSCASERSFSSSSNSRSTRRLRSDIAAIFGESSVDSFEGDSYDVGRKQLTSTSSEFAASACAAV